MPKNNSIQIRRGSNSEWISANPILASGEPALETDTLRFKIGDGSSAWSGLNYIGNKEQLTLVRNDTGSTIYAGQTLYISGIYNNSIPSVAKYIANGSISENLFIGLASSDISNNNTGYAISFGEIHNLNTVGYTTNNLSLYGDTSWTNGTLLYANPTSSGRLTSTPPTRAILVGTVIHAHGSQGKIFVKLKTQGTINDLYDVSTSLASANQYLSYNGSSWVPTSSGLFEGDVKAGDSFIGGSGTATSPSFKFTEDPDTGLFSPLADTIAISTSGVERLRVDNIGNVGIGNSPQSGFKLDVQGASVLRGQMNIGGGIVGQSTNFGAVRYNLSNTVASNSYSYICNGGGNFGVGFPAPSGRVAISGGASIGSNYNLTPPTNGLIVQGDVGIGTASPTSTLQVSGLVTANSGNFTDSLKVNGSLDVVGKVYVDGEANISGSINVSNGVINVNEVDSQYSAVLASYGLKLFDNTIDIEVTQVDTNLKGADFTSSNFLTPNGESVLGGAGPTPFWSLPEDGDIVLFANFQNPVNNGIYRLEQIPDIDPENPQYIFKAIRETWYTNGISIPNRYGVKITNNGGNALKFILNRNSSGNSIIGTDPLVFEPDFGDEVLSIQNSRDVDFAESISAKAKFFRIKHPDPKSQFSILQYGSLESPYNGVRLTGAGSLNKGVCVVNLPSYIKYLINEENMNIQLTNKGHHKILYIDNINLNDNSFTVKGYRAKTGGPFEFFWTFSGVRKDIDPLIVEY